MEIIEGGVTAAKGFMAAHTAAGIKYAGRDDMAMVFSQTPCQAAGTFTTNVVKAAPVMFDKKRIDDEKPVHAIVVNAGIANACTGDEGFMYCDKTAEKASQVLNVPQDAILVASTGVIGMQLPMDKIVSGIEKMKPVLSSSTQTAHKAAQAIMTTDTHPKEIAITFELDGTKVTVGGMCKGSGMIHPNMCTMLSFLTTDIAIDTTLLKEALSSVVPDTYNMISVDGDTSTNDSCLLLANGQAKNEKITEKGEAYDMFADALLEVNTALAKMMAGDGEGATALMEVAVVNARTKEDARILSKSVITSNLTKAAIFGHDANWGRILCALGYAGVSFDPKKVDITVSSVKGVLGLVENGVALPYSEEEATTILSSDEVRITCDMKMGDCEATAWGCDLSYDYVKINADYRS